jgi:RHS repeat-associated protein
LGRQKTGVQPPCKPNQRGARKSPRILGGRKVSETAPAPAAGSARPVTRYAYDLAGNKTRETDRLGRVTTFVFDAADRLVEERWQPSATASISHTIKRIYAAASQLIGVTETDTVTPAATTAWQYTYDALGNVVKSRMAPGEIDQQPIAWSGALAAGDSLIDWDGDGIGERYDVYSYSVAPGDVIDVTVTATAGTFTPALLLQRSSRPTELVWFEVSAGASQLVTSRTADTADTWTFAVTARSELAAGGYALQIVKDQHAIVSTALVEYDFAYDKAGNLLSATEDQAAVANMYGFGPAASGLGVRTSFTLDALNRVTRYEQAATGQVTKRADYAYRGNGSVGSVTRFGGAGVNPIGTSTATYDSMGRLTGITHAPSASPSIAYAYAYDAANRMTSLTTPEGTSSFTLDATDQLLSASLTGEAYAYDSTGNRTNSGTQTGSGNRLAFDGTYRYAYDAEGNRTAKFLDTNAGGTLSLGDTDVTVYGYDQRNRLVAVSHVNTWSSTQAAGLAAFTTQGTGLPGSDLELRYTYDYADRRIRRSIDADGIAGAGQESVSFAAYAGDVRTLEIARPNDKLVIDSVTGKVFGFLGQVVQRNFYGNGQDEILAVDRVTWNGTTPTTSTFWTFSDHQDSVREIVSGNAADRGKVVEHRQYDSFGKVVKRVAGAQAGAPVTAGVGIDFGYAGRPLEARTGLSDNRARWYEPSTGRFINEDPSGFKGGDANLFRYVGNDPLNQVDPSGLCAAQVFQSPTMSAAISPLGWSVLGKQASLTLTTLSPSVSAMAYAGLVRQPAQATAPAPAAAVAPSPSLRTQLYSAIDTWPTRGDTGYSGIDVPKAFVASIVGNAVAKPLAYIGTSWRQDTIADNVNAIMARNAAMNGGRPISTGYAMVQAFAGATTDNIAFGAVGYDPVQNRQLGVEERIQRFAGGTAAFATAFVPAATAARAVRAVPAGQAGLVAPARYFASKTAEELAESLARKYGSPRSTREFAETFYDPKSERSFNIHTDPSHGPPHVDLRRRGGYPERQYPLRESSR